MERGLWAAQEERAAPWAARSARVALQSLHLPHARVDSESKRWKLEHVVLDLFSHFTLGKIQWLSHVVLDLFSHIETGQIQWLTVSCRGSGFCDLFKLFASFA